MLYCTIVRFKYYSYVVLYMEEKERILNENFEEYFSEAQKALKSKKYNSAVMLFFKAISAGSDLFILKKEGFVPSSHTNRFRILQDKYNGIYELLDKDFPFYQDSYTNKMSKEAADLLQEDAKRIKKIFETMEE